MSKQQYKLTVNGTISAEALASMCRQLADLNNMPQEERNKMLASAYLNVTMAAMGGHKQIATLLALGATLAAHQIIIEPGDVIDGATTTVTE